MVRLNSSRANEHSILTPYNADDPDTRKYSYERLMQVSVQHTYYNQSGNECPDFRIDPTPTSTLLMQNLGLLFKRERAGFSILYDVKHTDGFLQYLRRENGSARPCSPPLGGVWKRLSFILSINNPYFVNFTDLPYDTNPELENLYFTNQEAHKKKKSGEVILNPNDYISEKELTTVGAVQFSRPVWPVVKEVRVLDISGECVICKPRCIPVKLTIERDPSLINCDDIHETSPPSLVQCRDNIFLDFSAQPEGKYWIEKVGYDSSPPGQEWLTPPEEILYTSASPTPFCFIDLLFTDPTGDNSDLYPVTDLFQTGAARITDINYQLKFKTRSTYWTYFIVPQPQREDFKNLRIESLKQEEQRGRVRPPTFAGPCCVMMPNGAKAYRFVSEQEIPLQQKSDFQFRLHGQHGLMLHDGIIVKSLPVASGKQMLQDEVSTLLNLDKNRCRDDRKCRRLIRRVGKCLCPGPNFNEELKRFKQTYANASGYILRKPRQQCPHFYSDTYVYV